MDFLKSLGDTNNITGVYDIVTPMGIISHESSKLIFRYGMEKFRKINQKIMSEMAGQWSVILRFGNGEGCENLVINSTVLDFKIIFLLKLRDLTNLPETFVTSVSINYGSGMIDRYRFNGKKIFDEIYYTKDNQRFPVDNIMGKQLNGKDYDNLFFEIHLT